MIVVIMGVTGSGKSTIGELLSRELGWQLLEADQFHSPANVEKMRAGIPLTDADRKPWLESLATRMSEVLGSGQSAIVACSALKRAYREILRVSSDVVFVCLQGEKNLIASRLAARKGHFMNPKLLDSQLDTLEVPKHAYVIHIGEAPQKIAEKIRRELGI